MIRRLSFSKVQFVTFFESNASLQAILVIPRFILMPMIFSNMLGSEISVEMFGAKRIVIL